MRKGSVLEVRLQVPYPTFSFSCSVEAGAIHVGRGPNGSGKTTFLKALAGLISAEGFVRWKGRNILELSPRDRAQIVGYLPQTEEGVPSYRVEEMVLMGRYPYWRGVPAPEDYQKVRDVLDKMALSPFRNRPMVELSGGERQWVRIARLVVQDPSIILLDEPEQHLDQERREGLIEMARAWKKEGRLVFWVSHSPCGLEDIGDVLWEFSYASRVLPIRISS